MLRVVLTGGIGTGKTVVLNRLRTLGVPVIEADAVAHAVIAAGTPGAAAVRARFGESVMHPDGSVDRARLGALVFGDERARRDLEAIVHPDVYLVIEQWMDAQVPKGVPYVVAEIPLVFETGRERDFDRILVTACEDDEQLRRVVARGVDEAEAKRRMAAQWPLAAKVLRADLVVRTDGSLADTVARTDAAHARLVDEATRQP